MLYALIQIAFSVLVSDDNGVSAQRVIFLTYEAIFCLLLTHNLRNIINRWRWLRAGMAVLIPRVVASVFVMGLLMYFLRMPISIPLGMFNSEIAFDISEILGLTTIYVFIFFLSIGYMIFHSY